MAVLNVSVGACVIVGWNLVSLCVEATLYARLCALCPAIHTPKEQPLGVPHWADADRGWMEGARLKVLEFWAAWNLYMNHEIRSAGLALAMLYMTVLAFDNYSRAYLFESGVNEALLGLLTSMSSVPGLIGSLLFPHLCKKFGVVATGLVGFVWLNLWLTLCVGGVFAPGSLFYLVNDGSNNSNLTTINNTAADFNYTSNNLTTPTIPNVIISNGYNGSNVLNKHTMVTTANEDLASVLPHLLTTPISQSDNLPHSQFSFLEDHSLQFFLNSSESVTTPLANIITSSSAISNINTISTSTTTTMVTTSTTTTMVTTSTTTSYCSIALLLTGIICSRFGLWIADLSVVQSCQELVAADQRGALSGVQDALNMFFDLLRSVLLIAWPRMDTFGYLILLSFVFVTMGSLSYCHFYFQRRHVSAHQSYICPKQP